MADDGGGGEVGDDCTVDVEGGRPGVDLPRAPTTAPAALVRRAASLVQGRERAVLGITGAPGAGKTTLAELLVQLLNASPPAGQTAGWVAHVPMDGYHLADAELRRLGRLDRKGAPDTFDVHGYAAMLARLRTETGVVVYAPAFDRSIEQPVAGSIPVLPSTRLVVTEGNYLLLGRDGWAGVRQSLDEVWYCDLPSAERRRRLVQRHEAFGKDVASAARWVAEVDERNAELIAATRDRADLVVDGPPAAQVDGGIADAAVRGDDGLDRDRSAPARRDARPSL